MPGRLINAGIVDSICPVDWSHSLNLGRVGWWLRVPNSGWSGGLTFRDLVRGGRKPSDGVLTGGPIWVGARGRPGGYGALAYDGANDYVDLVGLKLSGGATTPTFTIASWLLLNSAGANHDYQVWLSTGPGYAYYLSAGGGHANHYTNGTWMDGSLPLAAGVWQRVVHSFYGGQGYTYINGVQDAAVSTGVPDSASTHYVGRRADGAGAAPYFSGLIDDLSAWNRGLSPADIQLDYQESRRGHPDTLRWLSRTVWSQPVVIAPTWNSAQQVGTMGLMAG